MNIAFHSNQLSIRGTEVALYDYAHYNEVVLGNRSIILTPAVAPFHDERAITKFGKRFPVYLYQDFSQVDGLLREQRVDVLYCIKAELDNGIVSKACKTVVHAVFPYCQPHGDVYAYVSEWLAGFMSTADRRFPFVPHIVEPPRSSVNMRRELSIPDDAIVFGRYGGADTFDIDFARRVVQEVAHCSPDRYFLFMNTDAFCAPARNIIFLKGSSDFETKERFIFTCDAMLHARNSGETFGLSIAEFSIRQRPVITWTGSKERSHIELLGNTGIYYHDAESLREKLLGFTPDRSKNWDVFGDTFYPHRIMEQFKKVFLDS